MDFLACTQVSAEPFEHDTKSYCLIISCKKDATADAVTAEIYAPERICNGGYDKFFRDVRSNQRGFYALDLNNYNKGKPLEPIYIRAARGNSGVVVDQFTRHLPPTTVPKGGGTVSFDNRFAVDMVCSSLFETGRMPK